MKERERRTGEFGSKEANLGSPGKVPSSHFFFFLFLFSLLNKKKITG
jgi:hypothetical protein